MNYREEIQKETARIKAIITSESEIEETKILVNGVEIYRNGEQINTEFRGAPQVAHTRRRDINHFVDFTIGAEVQLHPLEESEITIYAKNASIGVTSEKRIVYYKVPKYDLYMLAIGISNYDASELKLRFADKDARVISDIFKTQSGKLFNNVYVKELYNAEATRANILAGLRWLGNKNNLKDVAVVFIAGHGKVDNEGNFYIVPIDGLEYEVSQGVTKNDIMGILRNISGTRLLLLDVCRGSMMANPDSEPSFRGGKDVNEAIRHLADAEDDIITFAATTGNGSAQERLEWGHGAFTKALIAGLKEGEADFLKIGVIYLPELYSFVAKRVGDLTRGQQKPYMEKSPFLPIYQWK
jgi:hypothetical protein